MGKLLVTELHEKISTQCLQFFGGNGYTEDYPMARMYRDSRIGTIGGGTSEIMREIIAKIVIDDIKYEKVNSPNNLQENPSDVITSEYDEMISSIKNSEKNDLSLAIKCITVSEETLNTTINYINKDNRKKSQSIRHQIAQLSSDTECYKTYLLSIYNNSNYDKNAKKEIAMTSLLTIQLMDKVVSQCFELFDNFDDLENHPLYQELKDSKIIQIKHSKRELLEIISNHLIK